MGRKYYRKIPQHIMSKIEAFATDGVRVYCDRKISKSLAVQEIFRVLGVKVSSIDDKFEINDVPVALGRFSKRNVTGWEVVRRDLPKISKTFYFTVPNWGGPDKGYSDVSQVREVYVREFYAAPELALKATVMGCSDDDLDFRFEIDKTFFRSDSQFNSDILFAANVLTEIFSVFDVYEAEVGVVVPEVTLDWEFFPSSGDGFDKEKLLSYLPAKSSHRREAIEKTLDIIEGFHPECFLKGMSGDSGYIGAKFRDDLVVFENLEHFHIARNLLGIPFDSGV